MLGDGQLGIVDGFYRLSGGFGLAAEIGAPLTIEQGRLVFAKTPIDMEYDSAIGDRKDSVKLRYDLARRIEL